MDWRYNQMWMLTPVVVGTFIETLEIFNVPVPVAVPVPVEPHAVPPQPPPPPFVQRVAVQESRYQFTAQGAATTPVVSHMPAELAPAKAENAAVFKELNSWNASLFAVHYSHVLKECLPTQWHQIIVKTPVPHSERRSVISAINKVISPQTLTPYFFRVENIVYEHRNMSENLLRMSFFVNMCGLALKTLCERDLKVPYLTEKFHEIELVVRLFDKDFNLSETLREIVLRRLDSKKKLLDLSYINNIPEVREMLYDPADNWHILDQMLNIAKVVAPELATLGLAGNGIATLTALGDFLVQSAWKSLRTLDLSDNEIKSTSTVLLSHTLQISEVYLDRNPICQLLEKDSYISEIKATFPHLAKLDGTYLHTMANLPYWKPNFIVSSTGDSGEFADQFIEHFFTLYDDSDRMKLRGLYHENAYFSLNCLYLDGQVTTSDARLSAYLGETRNLLCCSDIKKVRAALTRGSQKIIERLSNLPNTQHDPYTFAVDLTLHTPKLTVLTVTGVFRDIAKEKSSHRHFSRTFVLTGRENDEYQITNDILYISNAATREAEEAFQFVRPPKPKEKNQPPPNFSDCEKGSMIGNVQQLTNMSVQWSRKLLENNNWDLKKALQNFVELYEKSKIPESAFLHSR